LIHINLRSEHGWKCHDKDGLSVWFKGYLNNQTVTELVSNFASLPAESWIESIAALDGHFALILSNNDVGLAATDRISSIPLFYGRQGEEWIIDSQARRLADELNLNEVDLSAALQIGMAGFTIGSAVCFKGIEALGAGESVFFRQGEVPDRRHYYMYRPQPENEGDRGDYSSLKNRLADVTLEIFRKMIPGLDGREVIVPLSAGLDSRLVVSALKELGYPRIKCFSYGLKGNHEARAAKKIAEKLDVPWIFIDHSPRKQAKIFSSPEFKEYYHFADQLNAVPFIQDYYALGCLKERGYASEDAVFINGQSGDYLSGNHIPPSLIDQRGPLSETERMDNILEGLIAKHFDLWACLKTPDNIDKIRRALLDDIEKNGGILSDPGCDFSLFEMSEFSNRQVKYVIAGQRNYEWQGFDWRLPLWDNDYLDFWAAMPLSAKARQCLYRDMLEEKNWGGVWGPQWRFPKTITPFRVRLVRLLLKAAHLPYIWQGKEGRARWHRFEKRYFDWWTDVLCNYAISPYLKVAHDRRGHRNAISWHVEAYLAEKGLSIDGTPLPLSQ